MEPPPDPDGREDLAVPPHSELVSPAELAPSPVSSVHGVWVLEGPGHPETSPPGFGAPPRSGTFCWLVKHASVHISVVASCRVGMVGVGGDVWSVQPGGLLPDSRTAGVEAFSPPPPRVCLLPFRLRLWIPAWDLGLRRSTTGTESYLHRLDPQLRASLIGEGQVQPL